VCHYGISPLRDRIRRIAMAAVTGAGSEHPSNYTIDVVSGMVGKSGLNKALARQRLADGGRVKAYTVAWEDTSRTAGSVWGHNITDITLKVRLHDLMRRYPIIVAHALLHRTLAGVYPKAML